MDAPIRALRRFAAGKRISQSEARRIIASGFVAYDEYGDLVLTPRGTETLGMVA